MQSASAWAARLLATFPLYRDLLQPVALAVHEMRTGLALLVAARKGLQSAIQDVQLGAIVAQIGAFPQRAQGALHATTLTIQSAGMPPRPETYTKKLRLQSSAICRALTMKELLGVCRRCTAVQHRGHGCSDSSCRDGRQQATWRSLGACILHRSSAAAAGGPATECQSSPILQHHSGNGEQR